MLNRPAGGGGADAIGKLEDVEGADRIVRIIGEAQETEDVLDVRGFEKLEAAIFDEGDVPATQLDFQGVAVMSGAGG